MNSDKKHLIVTVELHSGGEQLRYESSIMEVQYAKREAAQMLARCMDWMINDTEVEPPTSDGDLVGSGMKYSIDIAFAPWQ